MPVQEMGPCCHVRYTSSKKKSLNQNELPYIVYLEAVR